MALSVKKCYIYVGTIKIIGLLFKRVMLNFIKVLRVLKLGSRINPATQFCALSKKCAMKNLLTTTYLLDGGCGLSGVSMPVISYIAVRTAGSFA